MVLAVTPSQPASFISADHNNGALSPSSSLHEARLLRLLSECKDMSQLKQIHAHTLRTTTTDSNLFLHSRILHFASMADTDYALRAFDQIPTPNAFMWNTLIRSCARSALAERKAHAMALYRRLLEEGLVWPDKYTFPFVLRACAYLFALVEGKQVHCHAIKLGFASDVYVNNSLIHFYSSCGRLDLARKVFDEMPERTVVSWNAAIDGLVQFGEYSDALKLFDEIWSEFKPDIYTIQSVVKACAGLGALTFGMWAHAYALRVFGSPAVTENGLMSSTLIEMYSKCGSLEIAQQVFKNTPKRDVTVWNSMILGFASHGKGEAALDCFSRLRTEGLAPNSITFVGVLGACNHRGMVDQGRDYFNAMINDYKIEPKLEHYGCLVDLFARAGFIDEALETVKSMPVKPDVVIWRSLLDSCAKQRASVELSEEMAKQILLSGDDASSGVYVLLSKVYALASRWNDVGLVRKLMGDEGVSKEPGCTVIEVDGVTHEFFAGDTSHPRSREIYEYLDVIKERLNSMGYSPDYSQAALVDEQGDTKRHSLGLHSERIAIAFGLLSSEPGVPIRIFKNLRVCNDCHVACKLISDAFNVEIIMRDRARFHHFKNGNCSCMDYW